MFYSLLYRSQCTYLTLYNLCYYLQNAVLLDHVIVYRGFALNVSPLNK